MVTSRGPLTRREAGIGDPWVWGKEQERGTSKMCYLLIAGNGQEPSSKHVRKGHLKLSVKEVEITIHSKVAPKYLVVSQIPLHTIAHTFMERFAKKLDLTTVSTLVFPNR